MTGTEAILDKHLRTCCASGPISYCDYIEQVLYAKNCGYYTSERERVGRTPQRDFYTAESLGPVFANLVIAAVQDILGEATVRQSQFIEIAAEPGAELLTYVDSNPFAGNRTIRPGQALTAEGPVVLFANEWLDALPFHRLIFRDGCWRERGVTIQHDRFTEVLLDEHTPQVAAYLDRLPQQAADGYELDLPLQTEVAMAELLAQDWSGLILLFDYGKTWQQLIETCPGGTARSYYKHQQGNDLLARRGAQDITCDVNWTPLEALLKASGLHSVQRQSQEAFFVHHGSKAAEAIVQASAWSLSPQRQTLMELIHPAHMGQRFQALWGVRPA